MLQLEKSLNIVEHYLLHEHDITVDFDKEHEDAYYHSCSLIEINTNQSLSSQLHGLLHEASHAVLGHGSPEDKQSILRNEILAWEHGKEIVRYLNITFDEKLYDRDCKKAISKYIRWIQEGKKE